MSDMIVAAGTGIGAFLILWGATRGKVIDLTKQAEQCEAEQKALREMIHGLHDVYVSYKHFNETMQIFREAQRETRDDVRKILNVLNARDL